MTTTPASDAVQIVAESLRDEIAGIARDVERLSDSMVLETLREETARTQRDGAPVMGLAERFYSACALHGEAPRNSTPIRHGRWWYWTSRSARNGTPQYLRAPVRNEDDWEPPITSDFSPVLHESELDGVQGVEPSADGGWLLILSAASSGHELIVLNPESRERRVVRDRGVTSATLAAEYGWVFYTSVDPMGRTSSRVWGALLDDALSPHVLLYEEGDSDFWVTARVTRSRQYLVVTAAARNSTEVKVSRLDHGEIVLRTVLPRRPGRRGSVDHAIVNGTDKLLFLLDDSESGKREVRSADGKQTIEDGSLFAQDDGCISIQEIHAFHDGLAVAYRREGLPRVSILSNSIVERILTDPAGDAGTTSILHGELTLQRDIPAIRLTPNSDWAQPFVRVASESYCESPEVWEFRFVSPRNARRVSWGARRRSSRYREARLYATAEDGARIPMSMIWADPAPTTSVRRGPRPTVLFVYGAYGVSLDPEFSIPRLILMDAGFNIAIAHVRGGGENGGAWHRSGSGIHKWRGIADYRDCAIHLIANGWVEEGKIVAHGRSAGGTIVAAAINEWPQLFASAIGQDPFVDPLGTLLDVSDALSRAEWREWGNPQSDPEARMAIARYSPLENIRAHEYPRVLAHVATGDAIVSPRESIAWIRALRHVGADAQLIASPRCGHAYAGSYQEALRETALDYAWACVSVGIHDFPEVQDGS